MLKSGIALLAAAAALGACAKSSYESVPAGIAYACEGRAPVRVAYDGGGARAKLWLWMDGDKLEMAAAPTLEGLRYMKAVGPDDNKTLAWATDGVEATLLEVPVGAMGGEEDRLLAKCRREGWSSAGK
jgi:hypothetical protein